MRNNLIRLHLYAGLFCFPYFIIFGVSSLNFNHHFQFMQSKEDKVTWQKQITIPSYKNDDQFSNDVRDSLGLMGWTLPWEVKKDSASFQFVVSHFAKDYMVKIHDKENIVDVYEKGKGFWNVFNGLHSFGGDLPNAPALINSWKYYQDITVVVLLFSAISGIYIFLRRKSERKAGLIILFCCIGLSMLIMLSVWL